ncbi:MAG: pyridoxamine 5'-phosphate oxidase family protein [Acetatifactor sp.]|nr:pyridoxamine 5'-phosphate oxidase family protein [Acetatifactor sp.]
MEAVERVAKFLEEAGTYFLATVDGDQPRVRPFGTVLVNDGKLYIQTGKVKDVSKQIAANPKIEISASKGSEWIRITGELVNDDNREVKVKMLEKMPGLAGMYSPDDDNMQMLYFKNAVATFCSFAAVPETVNF